MKKCSKCGQEKPMSEYFVRDAVTRRLHAQCKTCYKLQRVINYTIHYQKYREKYLLRAKISRHKARNEYRERMLEYLADKSCANCHESDNRVLEFDHVTPETKRFSVSQGVKLGYSWEEILKEIENCRILCANCHKKHTSEQYNWYKSK